MQTDIGNCGTCGNLCSSDSLCSAGQCQTATSSGWVEVTGSFTPTLAGTLTSADMSVSGPPAGVDIYIEDVTITATKL